MVMGVNALDVLFSTGLKLLKSALTVDNQI